ncbi:MAG: PAS domain S-box protein, partial [Bacteroidetes bacterium]|nr:PAS domain S-box protein [Bacteroidota bacterium]
MNLSDIRNFMFGTLRGRLILGVAIIHAVMMTLFIIDITMRQSKILLDRQVEEATALAQSLSTSAAVWIASDDVSGLQELIESQHLYPELMFAMFTDERGLILAHTETNKCGLYLLDLPSLSNKPVVTKSTEIIQVLTPARLDNRQIGWVCVGISRLVTAEKLAKIKFGGIIYALMAIAFGSLIAWWMGIWFTKRLYAVQNTIAEVRKGNHQARSKIEGTDEAASIATEFNVLLDTLTSQQALLLALINSSTDTIIFALDKNYCYTTFNKMHQKEMKKVWNVEIEVGMNLMECMSLPLLKAQAKHSMDRVLKGESFVEVQHQPGPDVYYELSWNPIFQNSEVIGITAFIRDITSQKLAEQKLKLLNFALNSVTDEAFLIDKNACFRYVNDESCRALGYSEEELLKMNVTEIDPDFPIERWQQHWNWIKENGFMVFETRHKTKQGNDYPVEISANYFEYDGQGFNLALARNISERKQAEKALQESEEKYRTLIQKIQTAVVVHGADTQIITCNPKAQELLGLTEDQLLGKTVIDSAWHFFLEDGTTAPLENYPVSQVLATRKSFRNCVLGVHRPDKEDDVWVLVNADAVFGENDEITQVIVTFIDISERKQVSASLAKTTDLLNEAQQLAHIGSWELDIINNSLHWSDEIYRLFEIDPEKFDATYEAFLNAIHPDDRELVNYTYTNSLKNKMPYTIDHRLLLSDGRIKIVHEQCESFYDADGKPIRSIGIVQDITDRKQTEEELAKHRDHLEALVEERTKQLQESEFNYRRLFETMFQGVVYQDAEGKVISMNPAAEMILGKTQSELIRKPSSDEETQIFKEDGSLFSGEEHPAMLALNTGHEVQNAVMKLYNPRVKEYRWINISAMPLFHQNETKPYQVYTLFNDITESKAAEEALRVSEERMRLFFERQLVGMAITSLEKGWIKVNDKLCEMLGYSAEELMRLTWSEMTYPEDLAPDVEQFERL